MLDYLRDHIFGILICVVLLKVAVIAASLISALLIFGIGLPGAWLLAILAAAAFEGMGIFLIVLYFTMKDPLRPLFGGGFGWFTGFLSALIDAIPLSLVLLLFIIGLLDMGGGTRTGAHDVGTGIGALITILLVLGIGAILLVRIVVGLLIGFVPGALAAALSWRMRNDKAASAVGSSANR